MPGPVAPWASVKPIERKIKIDDFIIALGKQEIAQSKLEEINETKIEPTSAILAPFILDPTNTYLDKIVVTQRPETMNSYSGHVSFPGGHIEPGDLSLKECALRETKEEIGVESTNIEIIARAVDTRTKTKDSLIAPFVGIIKNNAIENAKINTEEVDILHLIKTDQLLKPDNYFCEIWDGKETSHLIHIFSVKDTQERPVFIWGATAQIIYDLLSINFN